MADEHVAEELLRRFLRVEVSPEEARRVVRHFVGGCRHTCGLCDRLLEAGGLVARLNPVEFVKQ